LYKDTLNKQFKNIKYSILNESSLTVKEDRYNYTAQISAVEGVNYYVLQNYKCSEIEKM